MRHELAQGEAWPTNGWQARTHNFTIPGCYFVEVTIANNFDTYTFNHRVCVYNNVDCLELKSDSPVPFENLKAKTEFIFNSTCIRPTEAVVRFDFGDASPLSDEFVCDLYDEMQYYHDYMKLGL